MAVLAHTEHNEIEGLVFKNPADGDLVGGGIFFDILFSDHAMDLILGYGKSA